MTSSRTALLCGLALCCLAGSAVSAELPADARIVYDLLYGDGQMRVGRAEQQWRVQGGRYELRTDIVPVLGPRIRYLSKGRLTDAGLVPESFAEYRGSDKAPRVSADFDWSALEVRYGAQDDRHTAALERGAQDVNAFAFQLAWLGDKAAGSLQVATGKKVAQHRFAGGPASTITLNGQPTDAQPWRSGDSHERTEVWVAPKFANLPVRVVRIDDGKELRLVARELRFTPAARPAR
ncbi:DUF3108 domain-containing protein [Ideonella sp. BN130291]|uniref:DUF3108 domain-containing protein n=1 Tax=Ideonella sp. BN130291 TaxID=3112940 RepID=UPI002E27594A|nr:DUF3108 domain-containing protein [Ideonella sp. BN130291]